MPTFSSRRFKSTILIGAVLGLTALAVPTSASAAEACVSVPSAATQPWATYAAATNQFDGYEALYGSIPSQLIPPLTAVDADFTQAELDALTTSVGVVFTSIGDQGQVIGNAAGAQQDAVKTALLAIDPASGPATDAIFDGFSDELDASQYGTALNTIFNQGITAIGLYLQSVQAAITANTPRPVVTSATTDPVNLIATSVVGVGAFAGDIFYGGAADLVVYVETCAAALPPTGSSDPTPLASGAALLLLVGAGVLVVAKRRQAESA